LGYTLMEIVIAAALVCLVLVSVFSTVSQTHRAVSADRNRSNALCIGHATLETIYAKPWGSDLSSLKGPVSWPAEQLDGHTVQEDYQVSEITSQPSANPDFQQVTVTVAWNGGGKSLQVSGWWSR
jgi:type II secretory pathway pseudopilin PulG